jgi:hypothetical protein
MAGQPKVRPQVQAFADRLWAMDPSAAQKLYDALDPSREGITTEIQLKPAAVPLVHRFIRTYATRLRGPCRVVAAPRERRDHRRRRTGAARAAGCRSGQDPGEPPLDESDCRTPLREGAAA